MRENLEDQGLDRKLILKYIYIYIYIYRRNIVQRSLMDWCVSQNGLMYRYDCIVVSLGLDFYISLIGFVCPSDWISVSLR